MPVTTVRRASLAALLVLCAVPPAGASASARQDRTEAGIVREMNKIRASYRLPRLRTNRGLARAADVNSASMLRSGQISHGAFPQRVRRYVRSRHVGENVAFMARCKAARIVQMWLASAGHRRIMLSSSFRRVGIGRRASSRRCFVTADFASSR
jgi:uncharacterized protein YkwD